VSFVWKSEMGVGAWGNVGGDKIIRGGLSAMIGSPNTAPWIARISALTILGAGVMKAVPGAAAFVEIDPILMIAALTHVVAALVLPALAAKPRRADDERSPSPVREPAAAEPRETALAVALDKALRVADDLEGYRFFTRLLREQIKVVTGIAENASTTILSRLGAIDQVMSDLLASVEQSSAQEVATIVDRVDRQMADNRRMMKRFEERRVSDLRESEHHQEEIKDGVDALGRMARTVREIARQTNMLALNASLEAGRAGAAGLGFAVVAQEVKTLSRQSDATAVDIHNGIDKFRKTIQTSVDVIIHERDQDEDKALGQINVAIDDLAADMGRLVDHQRDVFSMVHEESAKIARMVMELMAEIQFQDITRQQLEALARTSEMVDSHVEGIQNVLFDLTADVDHGLFLDAIRDVYDGYVMESQRRSHGVAGGQAVPGDAGLRIELF